MAQKRLDGFSAGRMAAAIQRATNDREIGQRAAAMGERIGSEDGVTAAVEVIDGTLA